MTDELAAERLPPRPFPFVLTRFERQGQRGLVHSDNIDMQIFVDL